MNWETLSVIIHGDGSAVFQNCARFSKILSIQVAKIAAKDITGENFTVTKFLTQYLCKSF